jgi:hypothetical protein
MHIAVERAVGHAGRIGVFDLTRQNLGNALIEREIIGPFVEARGECGKLRRISPGKSIGRAVLPLKSAPAR